MGCCSSSTGKKRSASVGKAKKKELKGSKQSDNAGKDPEPLPKTKSDSDVVADYEQIHMISPEGCVVVMDRCGNHVWECSRVDWSATHIKMLLFWGPDHPEYIRKGHREPFKGWVLFDSTSEEKDPLVVEPSNECPYDPKRPPIGTCWERVFNNGKRSKGWSLVFSAPEQTPMDPTGKFQSASCTVDFQCEGNMGQAVIKMHKTPLTDEVLEDMLTHFKQFLCELAKRPDMTLFWCLDLQGAPPMSRKHIGRFLEWVDNESLPLRLLVRGSVIKLEASGFIGMAVQQIVKFILRLKPPPWPSQVVPSQAEAQAFIEDCMRRATKLTQETKLSKRSSPTASEKKDITPSLSKSSRLADCLEEMDDKPVPVIELDRQADHKRCQPCVCTLLTPAHGA